MAIGEIAEMLAPLSRWLFNVGIGAGVFTFFAGMARAIVAAAAPAPLPLAQAVPGGSDSGALFAAAGLVTAIGGVLGGMLASYLNTRKEIRKLELDSAERRHKVANRLHVLETNQATLYQYLEHFEDVLEIDRAWMREAHDEFGKELPEGFGHRVFDLLPLAKMLAKLPDRAREQARTDIHNHTPDPDAGPEPPRDFPVKVGD